MINYGLNLNSVFDEHFRSSVLAMLEKLGNRISDLETQVRNLNEKSVSTKNYQKEITDTERLDFISNNNLSITTMKIFVCEKYRNTSWSIVDHGIPYSSKTCLRQAIDAAMVVKNGN